MIVGTSGSGKTVFCVSQIIEATPYYDTVNIGDLKGDIFIPGFLKIDMSKIVSNPLHIENLEKLSPDQLDTAINETIQFFLGWMEFVIKDFDNEDDLKSMVDQDLNEMFNVMKNEIKSKKYRNRTLSDLSDVMVANIENKDGTEVKNQDATFRASVYRKLKPYINGSKAKHFNGQSTPINSNKVIYDFSKLNNFDFYEQAIHTWLGANGKKIRAYGTDGTHNYKSLTFVDEIHRILDVNKPKSLALITKEYKEVRGAGGDFWVSTQEFHDFYAKDKEGNQPAKSIVSNSHFKAVLQVADNDLDILNELYNLTPSEIAIIEDQENDTLNDAELDVNKGKGLFFIGKQRVPIHRKLDEYEYEIILPHIYDKLYSKLSGHNSRFWNIRESV